MAKPKTKQEPSRVPAVLAFVCWILPLAGLAFNPGNWTTWLVWLTVGTVLLVGWIEKHPA